MKRETKHTHDPISHLILKYDFADFLGCFKILMLCGTEVHQPPGLPVSKGR